jgi:hypothetical protein
MHLNINIDNNIDNNMDKIDDKWLDFLVSKNNDNEIQDYNETSSSSDNISDDEEEINLNDERSMDENEKYGETQNILNIKSTELYISTKSKLAYLNKEIDLKELFWNIDILSYNIPENGVIKKQIKYSCKSEEELNFLLTKLNNCSYYEQKILKNIKNPTGRVKFKDIRKISVGISSKDILNFRSKEKGAFYNCLVLILRMKVNDVFKEFHTKFFNTGKLEIPGIKDDIVYSEILEFILILLRPILGENLNYSKKNEIVLINSNFNCGFYINQEVLYNRLKYKYKIQCIYDPCCSYPGLQCKFYYNYITDNMSGHQTNNMTIKENKKSENDVIISFMIFRTGSVLISGKCDEKIINKVYVFIKNILLKEYSKIFIKNNDNNKNKLKNKKIRKKTILVNI